MSGMPDALSLDPDAGNEVSCVSSWNAACEVSHAVDRRVRVVADYRERRSGVSDRLASYPEIILTLEQLDVGDYLVDDRVVVERKSVADFAKSIVDTRLFRQAAWMNRSSYRPAVIVEGWFSPGDVAVPDAAMQGALVSMSLLFDIPVLHARDKDETARLLLYTARQLGGTSGRPTVWRNRIPKKPSTRYETPQTAESARDKTRTPDLAPRSSRDRE